MVYTCYGLAMGRGKSPTKRRSHDVLGTRELREQIPAILRDLREDVDSEPIVGGANRKPEIVILSYDGYLGLMDQLDNLAIVTQVRERLPAADIELGSSLEDAARELGLDPDEIFAKAEEPAPLDAPAA